MKRFLILMFALMLVSGNVLGASAPYVVSCGVDPVNVKPGEDFTLYANVADADGLTNIDMVGLLYNNELLMTLPKSDIPGRYQISYQMPETAPATTLTLSVAAMDKHGFVSPIKAFVFTISDPTSSPSVTLISPDDGAVLDCEAETVFAWQAPDDFEFVAYAFAFYLNEGQEMIVPLPAEMNQFSVPGFLWQLLPDGTYYWKVGMITEFGTDPVGWSELRSFTTECNHPWPTEIMGAVVEIDAENHQLTVASRWNHGPRLTTVQVTDETMIYGPDGELIPFEQIQLGDFAFCTGEFQNEVFIANEIYIETNPNPPGDMVQGRVVEIDPIARMVFIGCQDAGGETVPVQVTEDTIILSDQGPITFEEIQVGMHAHATGEWSGAIFVAAELFVRDGNNPPPPGDQVGGEIV
ncbi:hypothetical protein JW979_07180, partial [bacterium]|nr:hypothetical protein [candidate division CSSED10-310 bacterium]